MFITILIGGISIKELILPGVIAVGLLLGCIGINTICIKKENYPHFESVDCQAAYFHKITAVSSTQHIIESIHLNNPDVNYDTNENIHLYLKARR